MLSGKARIVNEPGGRLEPRSPVYSRVAKKQVVVRVCASRVNPVGAKIRAGRADHVRQPLPAVLGLDMAGIVERVGSGVKVFKVGDEGRVLSEFTALTEAGRIKPLLSEQRFSPEDLERPYACVEAGSFGKVAVEIQPDYG
jgi:alcohol dehydrogenase-like protein